MTRSRLVLSLVPSLALASACGGDDQPGAPDAHIAPAADAGPPDAVTVYSGPDDWCPGQPHCPGGGEAQLYAGAAVVSITPELVETEWNDVNGDGEWRPAESFTDVNGNGEFDALLLVNGSGRVAVDVHDDIEARAVALRWGDVTVVILYLDLFYLFIDEMDLIKADPALAGLDVDHIIIGSTHDHSAIDTLGLSGANQLESGVDPDYMVFMRARAAQAIAAAVADLRPARMSISQIATVDPDSGSVRDYVSDVREPIILDPTMTLLRFSERDAPDTTIATLINWASHPEYSWFDHNSVSADFVYWLRQVVEDGLPGEGLAGMGGVAVFVQGPLGGQIGPDDAHPIGPDGQPISEHGMPQAEAGGTNVGRLALQALADPIETVDEAPISYRTAEIYGLIENTGLITLGLLGVIQRQLYFYDESQPVDEDNLPWVRSRVTYLQVGPVALITAPGELNPELWVGGYDGSWSYGEAVLSGDLPNEPDLGNAPPPPYLRDLMLENPGVRYAFVAGLAEDAVGYIVAHFNYVLDPDAPYIDEADGDHYEETLSLGPLCEEHLQHPMMELARWRAPAQ